MFLIEKVAYEIGYETREPAGVACGSAARAGTVGPTVAGMIPDSYSAMEPDRRRAIWTARQRAPIIGPDNATIEALVHGRHGDPFAVLGRHGRSCAASRQAPTGWRRSPPTATCWRGWNGCHPAGFFAGAIPPGQPYRLRIRWPGGVEETEDPYSFGPLLGRDGSASVRRRPAFRTGPRVRRAMHVRADDNGNRVAGVRFAVWAPNASRVSVVGDFNSWDGRRHPMRKRPEAGLWEIFIPRLGPGEFYKYELLDANGTLLPLKADPLALETEHAAGHRLARRASVAACLGRCRLDGVARHAPGRRRADLDLRSPCRVLVARCRGTIAATGTRWRTGCCPTSPTSASRISSSCRSRNIRSAAPGAINRWACSRRPRGLGRRTVSPASSIARIRPASASSSTGCRRIFPPTRMGCIASTAPRCTSTAIRARACIATGTPRSTISAATKCAAS